MRNLKLIDCNDVSDVRELEATQCISIDYDTGVVYGATSCAMYQFDPQTQQVINQISLTDGGYLPVDGSGQVVGIQHIPDQSSVCVVTEQGDVLLWNTILSQLECVGCVSQGLFAMAWSPDQELLVLVTGQNTLIMMTRDFDPITEVPLESSEFGEAQFITVGWGKKETQFHGSEGKQMAMKKAASVKPALAWDDRRPRVSWRGDGQYFVVSSIASETGARCLRVWTRECLLHSTSEHVDGLEQCLAWKPSGSLIACSRRKPNKHEIVFFEINGLQHGEFVLPFAVNEVKVREAQWNNHSTVLALWLEQLNVEGASEDFKPKSYIQLWTVGNYHWYLKQQLEFSGTSSSRVATMTWDPEHAYCMHLVCKGGRYLKYTFSWSTNQSIGHTEDNQATVAVIDGDKVLMTPYRKMVVPPPMSAYHIQMSSAINHVFLGSSSNSNDIGLVLSDSRLALLGYNTGDMSPGLSDNDSVMKIAGSAVGNGFTVVAVRSFVQLLNEFRNSDSNDVDYLPNFYHFLWLAPSSILCIGRERARSDTLLYVIDIDREHNSISMRSELLMRATGIICMATNPDTGSVAIQLADATVLKYSQESHSTLPWIIPGGNELRFPQPCTQMAVSSFADEEVVIGLTESYRLYVNDTEIASNCTSFAVHSEFLLLTTHSHTCRCISRNTQVKDLATLADGKVHVYDESIRRVERGSRIVCVVAEDTKLVLQMPRGNLETIHPRALVLSTVRKMLDRLEFRQAFEMMRKHRINMNLLYDHHPDVFLHNVSMFVKQIESVNYINLFLTDLIEEDVTSTMYTAAYNRDKVKAGSAGGLAKVDVICDAIRESLQEVDEHKYLLSILTTYVKKTNPDLEAALQKIKVLSSQPDTGVVSVDEALKYLVFLVDVNQLYDVALGMYDFELVIMVAEKSHKDPKEYLPFLNELRRLETNYQKYTIDKHLKRYSQALRHISQCGQDHFDECMQLVKDRKLYGEALDCFTVISQEYKDIAVAYGDYLVAKHLHEEAAIMFMKADCPEQALVNFEECLSWKQCLCMAAILKYTPDNMHQLVRRLAGKLRDQRRFYDAACLLEQYANDVEEAIVICIEGGQWEEALRLMYKYGRTDFIESNLKGAILENCDVHMTSLEASRQDFEKYRSRLEVVREQKERTRLELLDDECEYNRADGDLFSDTSSAMGGSVVSDRSSKYSTATSQLSMTSSKRSGRSAKNRRKAERKKWSLKEGSPYEDIALVEVLSKIIKQTDELKREITSLLKMLILFNYEAQARQLQSRLDSLLSLMEKAIPEIWKATDERHLAEVQPEVYGPHATANSIAEAMRQGQGSTLNLALEAAVRNPPSLSKEVKWKLHIAEEFTLRR